MHVPTQSVPTRCQAGASASLPLERGRGRGYARDGVMVYTRGTRSGTVTEPADRVLVIFIIATTISREIYRRADDGCNSTVRRTAGHEWPFQVPLDVFR